MQSPTKKSHTDQDHLKPVLDKIKVTEHYSFNNSEGHTTTTTTFRDSAAAPCHPPPKDWEYSLTLYTCTYCIT